MTANPHILRAAQAARDTAIAARTQAKADRRKRMGTLVIRCVLVIGIFVAGHQVPRAMRLPKPGVMVVAWTGDNWYKAYADENGEFHDPATGMVIGQVIKWKQP